MHLPVRLAASLPIGIVMVGAIVASLARADGRRIHPVYGFPNGLLVGFLVAIPSLLLVFPNIAGALAANRMGPAVAPFTGALCAAIVLATVMEATMLNRLFRTSNFMPLSDWRLWTVIGTDILVLLGVAAWQGRKLHA